MRVMATRARWSCSWRSESFVRIRAVWSKATQIIEATSERMAEAMSTSRSVSPRVARPPRITAPPRSA